QTAVGPQPAEVAGAIDAFLAPLGIRQEGLTSELGLAPVACSQIAAFDGNLADLVGGYLLAVSIEQENLLVRGRVSHRDKGSVDLRRFINKVDTNRPSFGAGVMNG